MTGGGAKSPLWRQMVADCFHCQVVCLQQDEAGAAGAALQALWCAENVKGSATSLEELTSRFIALDERTRCHPDPDSAGRYDHLYRAYLNYDGALRSINGAEPKVS